MKNCIIISLSWLLAFFHMSGNGQPLQFTGHLLYQTTSRIFFTAASDLDEAFSTWVVDIDFDGDNDILASSYDPSKVVLFENDGNLVFTPVDLSAQPYSSTWTQIIDLFICNNQVFFPCLKPRD